MLKEKKELTPFEPDQRSQGSVQQTAFNLLCSTDFKTKIKCSMTLGQLAFENNSWGCFKLLGDLDGRVNSAAHFEQEHNLSKPQEMTKSMRVYGFKEMDRDYLAKVTILKSSYFDLINTKHIP